VKLVWLVAAPAGVVTVMGPVAAREGTVVTGLGGGAGHDRGRRPESALPSVQAPVLLLADPDDTQVPAGTARRLAQTLPDARLQLVHGAGHHLPRRAADVVADAIVAFLAMVEEHGSPAA
jgi:pimeloyl-ACP methyl ester carboxylesterase